MTTKRPADSAIVAFVEGFRPLHGANPSYQDVADHFGVSKSAAWNWVNDLADRNILRVEAGMFRSISVATRNEAKMDEIYVLMSLTGESWAPVAAFSSQEAATKAATTLNTRLWGPENATTHRHDMGFSSHSVPLDPEITDSGDQQLSWRRKNEDEYDAYPLSEAIESWYVEIDAPETLYSLVMAPDTGAWETIFFPEGADDHETDGGGA